MYTEQGGQGWVINMRKLQFDGEGERNRLELHLLETEILVTLMYHFKNVLD